MTRAETIPSWRQLRGSHLLQHTAVEVHQEQPEADAGGRAGGDFIMNAAIFLREGTALPPPESR